MLERMTTVDNIRQMLISRGMLPEELDTLQVFALPNTREFNIVTNRRQFRYNPETRGIEEVTRLDDIDRVIIREGTANRQVAAYQFINGEWRGNMATLDTNQLANELRQPEPPTDVIQVIVRRDNYGLWYIRVTRNNSNMALPEINVIKSLLPPEWKRILGGRHSRRRRTDYYLQQALEQGLPTQVLHDTLQAWAFTWVRATAEASSEAPVPQSQDDSFLLRAQPATIFVGGKSFKLVPTGERDNTNIYRHIRDKAKGIAQIEVQAKLDKAQTDARIMVSEAQGRVETIRREVEQLRASMVNQAPEWARQSGRPIKLMDERWWIGLRVSTYLEDIRYRVDRWRGTVHWNPIRIPGRDEAYYSSRPMQMWLRLSTDGRYAVNEVRGDIWHTVHNTTTGTCMELQGMPARVINMDNLVAVERGISRGMRVINFNSPLSHALNVFYPLYAEQLPDMVKNLITGNASYPNPDATTTPEQYLIRSNEGRPANNPRISWDRIESDAEELNYTFNVPATARG